MIRILDKNTADKIAAGEVVDRPVSTVKELVENSIDAGASSVIVEIKNGGKTYIRVTDDGSGIDSSEVEKAFMRHATSKIINADDLDHIETLGFRGEALASIAAVSRVELITKTKEEKAGTKLEIAGGRVTGKTGIGCADGTTVVVRDLFYNTPARLKFMKSDAAESGLITDLVQHIALCFPSLKVRMINNGNILFSTQGRGDRLNTIMTLTSRKTAESLIPVSAGSEDISVEGYVSGPGESRPSRRGQIFFVNGRSVKSKVIEKAVNSAYKERLFEGRHPIAYIFLTIKPSLVDVNVHPNKREVKFHNDKSVEQFISSAVADALTEKSAVPELRPRETAHEKQKSMRTNVSGGGKHSFSSKNTAPASSAGEDFGFDEQVDIKNILSTFKKEAETAREDVETFRSDRESRPESEGPFDFRELDYRGVIFGTYILATDDDYLYFLDQHAAHERVNFEKLKDQFERTEKHKQQIMIPITVSAGFREENWIGPLSEMGFDIEEFGPDTYAVRSIPLFMDISEAELFVNDYIDSISDDTDFESRDVVLSIASKACKASVKAHDTLKEEEIQGLINDLAACENPYSCPHGRPTFIRIGKYDIERRFKRK
ncbi:MAG: DNA mismatch repair endonuclease MutL [Anaerovoracaceae bacterium]|jgi:DNA mismatch repair protein MutL